MNGSVLAVGDEGHEHGPDGNTGADRHRSDTVGARGGRRHGCPNSPAATDGRVGRSASDDGGKVNDDPLGAPEPEGGGGPRTAVRKIAWGAVVATAAVIIVTTSVLA